MNLTVSLMFLMSFSVIFAKENSETKKNFNGDLEASFSDGTVYHYLPPAEQYPASDNRNLAIKVSELNHGYQSQPSLALGSPFHLFNDHALLTALLLSATLGTPGFKHHKGSNHPDHLQGNPYIALLLSQYGRYLPAHAISGKGLYYYGASNNYHNNKPFGAYKISEDTR